MSETASSIDGNETDMTTPSGGRRLRTPTMYIPIAPDIDGEKVVSAEVRSKGAGRRLLGAYFEWRVRMRGRVGRHAIGALIPGAPEIVREPEPEQEPSEPLESVSPTPRSVSMPPMDRQEFVCGPSLRAATVFSEVALDDQLEGAEDPGAPSNYELPAGYLLPGSRFDPDEPMTLDHTPVFRDLLIIFRKSSRARWYMAPLPTSLRPDLQ